MLTIHFEFEDSLGMVSKDGLKKSIQYLKIFEDYQSSL